MNVKCKVMKINIKTKVHINKNKPIQQNQDMKKQSKQFIKVENKLQIFIAQWIMSIIHHYSEFHATY